MSSCRLVRLCSDTQCPWAGAFPARGASNSQPPSFSRGAKAAAAKRFAGLKACSLHFTRTETFQLFVVGNTESRRTAREPLQQSPTATPQALVHILPSPATLTSRSLRASLQMAFARLICTRHV